MKKCICFRNGIENVMENKDKLYLMEDLDNMRKCWIDLMIEYEILENERKNCYK